MKLIGLDVGTKRIGVAKADTRVRIAIPVGTVEVNDGAEFNEIARIARLYGAEGFVIGLPRNVQGAETAQSDYVREFAKQLQEVMPSAKIRFQDETLTSVEAEARLKTKRTLGKNSGAKTYAKGDIDTESAVIILQDCLEHFANLAADRASASPQPQTASQSEAATKSGRQSSQSKTRHPLRALLCVLALLLLVAGGCFGFYQYSLTSVGAADAQCSNSTPFTVAEGETADSIAARLEQAQLIRSALVFRIYNQLHGTTADLKPGAYPLCASLSTPAIVDLLVAGPTDNVFSFTILPGSTIFDVQASLRQVGYSDEAITAAFTRDYSTEPALATLLATKPAAASLEGYLYGETYEFYKDETVDNILIRAMTELAHIVEQNGLVAAYEAQGLTLHQGITLASILQKESTANSTDYATVAQVLYKRLRSDTPLGADATVKYAIDLIDPDRQTYDNNAAALEVDSPYNTRKYPGLPPTPISNPGLAALLAAGSPADTDYLYFLTGDDGMMYYSSTESEHHQAIADHCQELCALAL